MKTTTEQMDASQVFCPNEDCEARGQVGQGNIVSHGKVRARYRCKTCGKTFSAQAGTMFEGLHKPKTLSMIVVTLLAYGWPIQAIVQAFGLDERTVESPARSGREPLEAGSTRLWCNKGNWIWCTCRPMRSGSRDGRSSSGWDWR